jgi:hypothetical protein
MTINLRFKVTVTAQVSTPFFDLANERPRWAMRNFGAPGDLWDYGMVKGEMMYSFKQEEDAVIVS